MHGTSGSSSPECICCSLCWAQRALLLADATSAERQARHTAARLRTKQLCDIATLAWDAQLEGLVRQACPLALALDWSPEVDPEVVRWQAEVCNHQLAQRKLVLPAGELTVSLA